MGPAELVHGPLLPVTLRGGAQPACHCHSPAAAPASHQWATGTPKGSDEQKVMVVGTGARPSAAAWAESDSRGEICSFPPVGLFRT